MSEPLSLAGKAPGSARSLSATRGPPVRHPGRLLAPRARCGSRPTSASASSTCVGMSGTERTETEQLSPARISVNSTARLRPSVRWAVDVGEGSPPVESVRSRYDPASELPGITVRNRSRGAFEIGASDQSDLQSVQFESDGFSTLRSIRGFSPQSWSLRPGSPAMTRAGPSPASSRRPANAPGPWTKPRNRHSLASGRSMQEV